MIPTQITIGIVTHGRTRRSTSNLIAHLYKNDGQTVRIVALENVPARTAEEALRIMEVMRDGSRKAEIAFHHITINPLRHLTEKQRDEAVQRILQALGAEEHPWVLWEHDGKKRATAEAADHHYHLVLGHIGPDLRALDVRGSYARLEAVARSLEIDWGVEILTPTRRHKAVAAAACEQGREDVAQAVLATMPDNPEDLPRSTMSSRTRARAARHGIHLPRERVRIADAYRSADSGRAVGATIESLGFSLIKGQKEDVWLVMKGDILLGALDRLVRAKRKEVAARLNEIRHEDQAEASPPTDASNDHNALAIDSIHDRIHERRRNAYEVLEKAQEPPPAPLGALMAQAELQTARKASDQAERDVTWLETELQALRDDAPGGFWTWRRGASRQHRAAIEKTEAAVAEAKRIWATAEQAARNRAERVKELRRDLDRDTAQRSRKHEADIQWAKAELEWLSDAERVLESDPALARRGWDALEQAVSQMRSEMAHHADPNESSYDLEDKPLGMRF